MTEGKETFEGFSKEEVRSCARKIIMLTDCLSDEKPAEQKAYKDVSRLLEQKLFSFYLYKKSRNCNLNDKSSMVQSIDTFHSISFCKDLVKGNEERKLQKRKGHDGEFTSEEFTSKKIKLNVYESPNDFSNENNISTSFSVSCQLPKLLDLNAINFYPSHNKGASDNRDTLLKHCQGISNLSTTSIACDHLVSCVSLQKPLKLREPKLNLKKEEKDRLKEDLIRTLKCEMKENYYADNGISEKLKNLKQFIKEKEQTGKSHSANVSAHFGDQESNIFDSLSQTILSKVGQLVATSQIYISEDLDFDIVTELVRNEGLVIIPEVGSALVTSCGQLDIVVCFVCGSAGRPPEDKLLFCNACCEPYHRYCLGFRITESNENKWTCYRCQKGISIVADVIADFVTKELAKILNNNYNEDWNDPKPKCKRKCVLCFKAGDLPSNLGGRLLYIGSNQWVHVNCILWSEGVKEMKDGRLVNVRRVLSISKTKYCSYCSRPGAGLKCALRPCPKRFHFGCAMDCQCSFGKTMIFYCPKHASIMHRSNITSIFKVKRRIFASDPECLAFSDFYEKSVTIGSFKLVSLKNGNHGFRSHRRFWSTRDPRKMCTYYCSVFEMKKGSEECNGDSRMKVTSGVIKISDGFCPDQENLMKNLIELKRLKMVESKKYFEKFVQLDGTAGFDDSDEDDDNAMSFHSFSDSVHFDDPHDSDLNLISPAKKQTDSLNLSEKETMFSSSIGTSISENGSKLNMKVNPTPVKLFGGQVSYLGSVVAASLQSFLKPKQVIQNVDTHPACTTNSFDQLLRPAQINCDSSLNIFIPKAKSSSSMSSLLSLPISCQTTTNSASKSKQSESNITNSLPSIPERNLLQDCQASTTSVNVFSAPQIAPLSFIETTPMSFASSITNSNSYATGGVQLVGPLSCSYLNSSPKPKVGILSPLESSQFPNLHQMNLQLTYSPTIMSTCAGSLTIFSASQEDTSFDKNILSKHFSKHDTAESASCLVTSIKTNVFCHNADNISSINTSKTSCYPDGSSISLISSTPEETYSAYQTGMRPTSSVVIQSSLLKPAVGFSAPQPFTSSELMFSDSEDEQEDESLLRTRLFSDFEDFVKNFESKTNAISMPMLKLRRCDHMIKSNNILETASASLSISNISLSSDRTKMVSGSIHPLPSLCKAMSSSSSSSLPIEGAQNIDLLESRIMPHESQFSVTCKTTFTCGVIPPSVMSPSSKISSTQSFEKMLSSAPSLVSTIYNPANSDGIHFNQLPIISHPLVMTSSPLASPMFRPSCSSSNVPTNTRTSLGSNISLNNPTPQDVILTANAESKSNQHNNVSLNCMSKPTAQDNRICTESNVRKNICLDIDKTRDAVNSNSKNYERMVVFEIKSSDGFSCSGNSVEEAWSKVKSEIDSNRHKLSLKPVSLGGMSGMTFFGLDHPVIINLIQNQANKKNDQLKVSQVIDSNDDVLMEVAEGCARFKPFTQRKQLDLFHFLLSEHRKTIKISEQSDPNDDDDDDANEVDRPKSTMFGVDLPVSTRYKNMRALTSVSIAVQRSRIHGRGLFAMRDIESGEMVIEYCGQIIRSTLTDAREKMYESKGIGCYMFRVDDSRVVDATMKGNAARFINHSCDPNCSSKIIQVDGLKHIVICATRMIRRGEELTYNYKFPIEEGNKIPCKCGSRKCKKFMN